MKGITANIPPSFCYKRGADAGSIPNGCPPGYFRSVALCYKRCEVREGIRYYHWGGTCW